LFSGGKRPLATHVVFSLHFYSFQLIVLCSLLLLLAARNWLGGGEHVSRPLDSTLFVVQLAVSALYLYLAIRVVYGVSGLARIAKAFVLTLAVGVVVLGYRLFVFGVTLYST
jgi:hypothetical protein